MKRSPLLIKNKFLAVTLDKNMLLNRKVHNWYSNSRNCLFIIDIVIHEITYFLSNLLFFSNLLFKKSKRMQDKWKETAIWNLTNVIFAYIVLYPKWKGIDHELKKINKVSKCTDCCYAHVQNVSSLVDTNDVSLRTNSATNSIKTIWMFCTLFQHKKIVPH